jgi:SAM-dependent methyltransferase
MKTENCCVVTNDHSLNKNYWDNQYLANTIGWDLGQVSPPIKEYIDTIANKNAKILIPGCGNSYEAEYLLANNFTNITILDISPTLVKNLEEKFKNNSNITILLGDFFEHQGNYDYILEQTFFCALPILFREKYVSKMHKLLSDKGILFGLLFNRKFEKSPPFGGSLNEYVKLFQNEFVLENLTLAENSVPARENTELCFEFIKKNRKAL